MTAGQNPFARFLESQGVVILDGGLATTLEDMGCTLDAKLWSAGLLRHDPGAVVTAHRAFLEAGADCIATVGYQASFPGCSELGLSDAESVSLLEQTVQLAVEARDIFWSDPMNRAGRERPLVAASVGPYGAYLGDGSEYHGRYDIDRAALADFHRRRFQLFANSAADLVACETIPSGEEAEVLLEILADTPTAWAWISFSCRDGGHLHDGTPIGEVVRLCEDAERVAAIGVNCTAPAHVTHLIDAMRSETTLPILAYPNSGEGYDAESKDWTGGRSDVDLVALAEAWVASGAEGVGGCCRVVPERIRALRGRFVGASA
jgi:homocysteine S-methyltransferase